MGYFSHITDHSFSTAPTGERLFLYGGIWSRPYVIPDLETEMRLRRKQKVFLKSVLLPLFLAPPAIMIVVLVIAVTASSWNGTKRDRDVPPVEDVSEIGATSNKTTIQKYPTENIEFPKLETDGRSTDGVYSLAILIVLASIISLGRRLLFRNELKKMRRLPTRMRMKELYRPLAKRNSYALLIFCLLMFGGAALPQTYGWARRVWVQGIELETFVSLIGLAGLWFLSFVIGYQLFLKITDRSSGPQRAL